MKSAPTGFFVRDIGMTEARECVPELGNSVAQDWISKGLAEADKDNIGPSRALYRFSTQDVVHLMFLSQLSRYGLLRSPDRVRVRLAHAGDSRFDGAHSLYDIKLIRSFCESHNYLVGATAHSFFSQSVPSKRAKRGYVQYMMTFMELAQIDPTCALYGFRDSVFISVARLAQEATSKLLKEVWPEFTDTQQHKERI